MDRKSLIKWCLSELPLLMARHDVPILSIKVRNGTDLELGTMANLPTAALEQDIATAILPVANVDIQANIYSVSHLKFKDEFLSKPFRLERNGSTFSLDKYMQTVWIRHPHEVFVTNVVSGERRLCRLVPEEDTVEDLPDFLNTPTPE